MLETDRGEPGKLQQGPQLRVVPAEPPGAQHWQDLSDAGNELGFCSAWLALLCGRMPGVTAGLLLVRQPSKEAAPLSVSWPTRDLKALGELSRAASQAYHHGRTITAGGGEAAQDRVVAIPLGAGGEPIAAVALRLPASAGAGPHDLERLADELRWGTGWLEALPWARRFQGSSADMARALSCLDLLALVGEQSRLQATAIAIANDLAARLRCDRVAFGIRKRTGVVRVTAISHSASFKEQGPVADAIGQAMEEAADQDASVAYPPLPSTERASTMAHRALAELVKMPGASVLSVVLADNKGTLLGAITLERHAGGGFDAETLRLAEAIAALLGPTVALQVRANRMLAGRMVDSAGKGASALLGPRRPALKLGAICAAALVLVLALAKGEHRVTARTVLEGEVQRAAVAPFEGFIRAAPFRAGDRVKGGDLLAALDDRDLLLDRSKWRAERDKLLQKQREALAKHDRSNLAVLGHQIRQAESQVSLADEKLARAQVVAPFDGIVVSGDLSQMLGSPVEKGKVLFEIAPLNSYRLIVHVDERDIRYVAAGQSGTIALAGMPWTPLPLVLTKITPVAVAEEGRNSFRVEAQLKELAPQVRPGMEGVAKIETGQRSILWIWTRGVIEWLSLAAWKYLP